MFHPTSGMMHSLDAYWVDQKFHILFTFHICQIYVGVTECNPRQMTNNVQYWPWTIRPVTIHCPTKYTRIKLFCNYTHVYRFQSCRQIANGYDMIVIRRCNCGTSRIMKILMEHLRLSTCAYTLACMLDTLTYTYVQYVHLYMGQQIVVTWICLRLVIIPRNK
jgi:hypothetical protein